MKEKAKNSNIRGGIIKRRLQLYYNFFFHFSLYCVYLADYIL